MKNLIFMIVTVLFFTNCSNSQKINYQTSSLSEAQTENLKFITKTLEEDIPNYSNKLSPKKGFVIESGDILGVNIYDLNTGKSLKSNFQNNHSYHISPMNFQNSFSYILCVIEDEMFLFKSINCKDRGNSLNEVVQFVNDKFSNIEDYSIMLRNIKDYRDFGVFLRTDSMTVLKCECEPCE